jgi:hypothetical protein
VGGTGLKAQSVKLRAAGGALWIGNRPIIRPLSVQSSKTGKQEYMARNACCILLFECWRVLRHVCIYVCVCVCEGFTYCNYLFYFVFILGGR